MFFIGLMSGTSMDAVDAVLADIDGTRVRVIAHHSEPIPTDLRAELWPLSQGATAPSLEGLGRMHIRVGRTFANAALFSMAKASVPSSRIVAIGSHGQTVWHSPKGPHPFSFQIGDPDVIAEETGITTVANFRGADIAAGGQGAPLTPAFHEAQFRRAGVDRVVLNLGGIANITVLPGESDAPVRGFDTGPGNALMDEWALLHLGTPMDRDGLWAAAGTPVPILLTALKADPYFALGPPKSTGRDHFNGAWLAAILARAMPIDRPEDVQATLLRLTADTIAEGIHRHAPATREVLICGGGAYNRMLVRALEGSLPGVQTTGSHGLDPQCVEATAFAWLAHCRLEGRPANLPSVTGARRRVVLGAVYGPGRVLRY
jgi:anhydro-N-acetylmuramic acid kinase